METLEIKSINELNYSICAWILRNRAYHVSIHCLSEKIIGSLEIYMTEIGIPWGVKESGTAGIRFYQDYSDLDSDELHIIITDSIDDSSRAKMMSNVFVFLLRDITQEEIESLVQTPDIFDIDAVPIHLQNEEIRKMFLRSFIIVQDELDIISPWMNFSVVNEALINLMEAALRRGVKIRIIYGLLPNADGYDRARSDRSDMVAARLRERLAGYGDAFRVTRDNIHYKLVLCDEKFKLEGGYNYLSFTGDYSDPNTRREGSPFGRDETEIRFLRKEYFSNDTVE